MQVLQQSGLPTAVPLQQAAPGDRADGDTAADPVASPDVNEDQHSGSEQTVSIVPTLSRLPIIVMLMARFSQSIVLRPCFDRPPSPCIVPTHSHTTKLSVDSM